jgi:hypothetical protein
MNLVAVERCQHINIKYNGTENTTKEAGVECKGIYISSLLLEIFPRSSSIPSASPVELNAQFGLGNCGRLTFFGIRSQHYQWMNPVKDEHGDVNK